MKRLLITLLFLKCIAFAENESITINDNDKFYKEVAEKLIDINCEYNLIVETMINISENGEMSYKIIKNSDIPKFNTDVINFLEEKRKIKFPNLRNKSKNMKITFRPEPPKERPKLTNIKKIE